MKFKTNKPSRNLLIGSLILAASAPAWALKSDSNQPVSIDSLKQSLDMQSNVSTFTDNVVIKQGTIDIKADKVVVTRPGGDVEDQIDKVHKHVRGNAFYVPGGWFGKSDAGQARLKEVAAAERTLTWLSDMTQPLAPLGLRT